MNMSNSCVTLAHNYETQANNFLLNHFYNCELGNTMPLAIANALRVSFVVFTSHERSPVYYICHPSSFSNQCFIPCTHGVWRWTLRIPSQTCSTPTKSDVKCRCGINKRESKKENYTACNNHPNGRHSLCKCLLAGKACSSDCKCKGCDNPHANACNLENVKGYLTNGSS